MAETKAQKIKSDKETIIDMEPVKEVSNKNNYKNPAFFISFITLVFTITILSWIILYQIPKLSEAETNRVNIIIKKMIVDAEVLDSKLIFNSKLDLVIGSADAAIEILLPSVYALDEAYILNFEIKMTRIDPDIATIIDASILTLGLPIQKTSYGYLFKVVGTLDNPQPVIE